MKVLATYNIKGGVGKTASAVNLAYLAARDGARTLVWDLDPQGATSFYFRVGPRDKVGARALVRGKHELDGMIRSTDHEYLDLLPANISYRNLDLALEETKKPTRRISRLVEPLAVDYQYLFLDCPPSLSLVSENVFNASDALLMPMIPTTLSLLALEQVREFLAESKWRKLRLLPFFTMVDRRRRMHRDLVDDGLRPGLGGPPGTGGSLLESWIAASADVERMGPHQSPVGVFAPRCRAALAYEELWEEIRVALK
ncbi:MAG: ParA family protein [Acidimicrobiia bacterium]